MKEVDSIETKSGKLETLIEIREEIGEMLEDCKLIFDHNYKMGYKQALLNVLNTVVYEMDKLK